MSLEGTATGKTLVGRINKCDLLTISAYGIAVKNGFEGTEEQWLESLKPDGGYHAVQHAKGGKDPITPAMIGARPDTWMPTVSDVGAAPAELVDGFYTVADGTDEEFLEVINTVYASMPDRSVRYIVVAFSKAHPIVGGSTYIIKISRVYADYGTLEMSSYSGLAFCRTRTNNAWKAFECDNPNMTVGVEYRTTERWNGKAVYTALVSMGNLPNATTKSVSVPGDKVATNIVRFNAIATLSGKFAYDMMCLSGVTRVEFRYGTDSNVYMNVATNTDMSAYSGTFQLWYTKD